MEPRTRLDTAIAAAATARREIARLEAEFGMHVAAAEAAAKAWCEERPTPEWNLAERALRAELAVVLRVSERQAERWIHESRTLVEDLPATLEALAAGRVSRRAAALIAESKWTLGQADSNGVLLAPDEIAERCGEFDAAAAELAARIPEHRLRPKLVALRDRLHAVAPAERHRAAAEERHVRVTPAEDGMAWLTAYLPAVEAYAIQERLTRIATVIRTSQEPVELDTLFDSGVARDMAPLISAAEVGSEGDAASGSCATRQDETSLDRLRADLLIDHLLRGEHVTRFDAIRPQLVVTVPVMTLLGQDDPGGTPPTLEGYGPIDPVTARKLTAEAPSLYRLLTDPRTGARLDLSRTTYRPTADLRMWLRLRDETCRFPGCARGAAHCDLDHTIAWEHGGPTSSSNLAHLCRAHHTLKHHTSWRARQSEAGGVTWTSPLGREVAS